MDISDGKPASIEFESLIKEMNMFKKEGPLIR